MKRKSESVREYVMWGTTGQSIVIDEFLQPKGFRLIALFDNKPDAVSPFVGVPVLYGREGFANWRAGVRPEEIGFCVAIGGEHGTARAAIGSLLCEAGLSPLSAVHPQAIIARNATLGQGVQIMAGAVLAARAAIGDWCIVNTAATVDHECRLGSGVHIGPGAHLAGLVTVEDYGFVGTGAVVLPRLTIGRGAVVGAGAVVTHDVEAGVVVCGNPARYLRPVQSSDAVTGKSNRRKG